MIESVDTAHQSDRRKRKRRRLPDFEEGSRRHGVAARKAQAVEHALRERLKELNCLYGISRLVEHHRNALQPVLQGVVDLLPPSWQYPQVCCARLALYDDEYTTSSYRRTEWKQSAAISVEGESAGVVEVYYFQEMPQLDEGPFLKEERDLINAIAERIGHVVQHVRVERQLRSERSALHERVKELNCLYGISRLVEQHRHELEPILQGIVDFLPPSWQYPEICCGRLILYDAHYATAGFKQTEWKQSAEIRVNGAAAGIVEVCYQGETPELDEGPFLKEERDLINAIAERTGKIVERIQIERQLEVDRSALRESNAALRKVLAQIEEDKKEIHDSVMANVDKILMPVLRALEGEVPAQQKKYVALLKNHLDGLTSPFANRLSAAFAALTPVEIEICNMIRDGLTTKDVAQIRHVAPATVAKQRERIRKKLGVMGTETNLATHLRMFTSADS